MSVPSCPTCDRLSDQVLAAVTRHIKVSGYLEIAKLERNAKRVSELEQLVDQAGIDRVRAEKEYSEHNKNSHADAGKPSAPEC